MKRPLLVCLAFGAGLAGAAQARDYIVDDHLLAASDAPAPTLLGDHDSGRPYDSGTHAGPFGPASSYRSDGSDTGSGTAQEAARTPTTPDAAPAQPARETARSRSAPSAAPAAPRKSRGSGPSWQSLLPGSIQ